MDDLLKFGTTVRNAERFARESPQGYTIAVAALASLGYLYIGAVIVGTLALIGGLAFAMIGMLTDMQRSPAFAINVARIAVPMFVGLIAFLASVVKCLWVVIPPPDGPELTRETAGRLFAFLDDLSKTLKAPRIHHILISGDFNAGVVQVPRWGLMGMSRNYLMIGLPLMKALSREQFRAIMGHELGHVSADHSHFVGGIYRQRETWMRILRSVRHNWIFAPFLNWYANYFFAFTFVLARQNEYVADKCAAEVAGARVAAETLAATEVRQRYLEEKFWPSILGQVKDKPIPDARPFTTMFRKGECEQPTQNELAYWLMQAWMVRTGVDDTHPSLSDRLSALGFRGVAGGPLDPPKPPLPPPPSIDRSAADDLLGPSCDRLTAAMDADWRQSIRSEWGKKHAEAGHGQQRLEILTDRSRSQALNIEEAMEHVQLASTFDPPQTAATHAWALARNFPRSAKAQALAGMILLRTQDQNAIRLLETAATLDPQLKETVQAAIVDHLRVQGKWAEAHQYQMKIQNTDPPRRA